MSAALWTNDTAANATGGKVSGEWAATGVSIDSRSLAPGDLFVALKGPNFDGHDFLDAAYAAGAAAAMVDDSSAAAGYRPLLQVDDTLAGLNGLGAAARQRTSATVIAVFAITTADAPSTSEILCFFRRRALTGSPPR